MTKRINCKLKSLIGLILLVSLCSIGCTNNEVTENVTSSVDTDSIQEEALEEAPDNVEDTEEVLEEGITDNVVDEKVTSNSTKKEYDFSTIKSIEEIEDIYAANIDNIKSGKILQPNQSKEHSNYDNVMYEAERIPNIVWKLYGTSEFRTVIEKSAILSDIANHISLYDVNEIIEYITGEFEVNCLYNDDSAGSNMFLLKIVEIYYTNMTGGDNDVIRLVKTFSEMCEDVTYSTPYDLLDRFEVNLEIAREYMYKLGYWK